MAQEFVLRQNLAFWTSTSTERKEKMYATLCVMCSASLTGRHHLHVAQDAVDIRRHGARNPFPCRRLISYDYYSMKMVILTRREAPLWRILINGQNRSLDRTG